MHHPKSSSRKADMGSRSHSWKSEAMWDVCHQERQRRIHPKEFIASSFQDCVTDWRKRNSMKCIPHTFSLVSAM